MTLLWSKLKLPLFNTLFFFLFPGELEILVLESFWKINSRNGRFPLLPLLNTPLSHVTSLHSLLNPGSSLTQGLGPAHLHTVQWLVSSFSTLSGTKPQGTQHRMLEIAMLTSFLHFYLDDLSSKRYLGSPQTRQWTWNFTRKLETRKRNKRWQEVSRFLFLFLDFCWGWVISNLGQFQKVKWRSNFLWKGGSGTNLEVVYIPVGTVSWLRVNESGLTEWPHVPSSLFLTFSL